MVHLTDVQGRGEAEAAGLTDGPGATPVGNTPKAAAAAEGEDALPPGGTVPCGTGFSCAFASAAAVLAATFAGPGDGALAAAEVFINSRRTAESDDPLCE